MSDIVKEASAAALNIINTGEHFWRKGRTGAEPVTWDSYTSESTVTCMLRRLGSYLKGFDRRSNHS